MVLLHATRVRPTARFTGLLTRDGDRPTSALSATVLTVWHVDTRNHR
ncbi:hypothetical protein AB0D16_25475 [Streptomyces sp. NPDC048161]|jgi:hypothetical protein